MMPILCELPIKANTNLAGFKNLQGFQNDISGNVYQYPASYPLKKYSCSFDGTNTVMVRN